jgi:hypothetical protein
MFEMQSGAVLRHAKQAELMSLRGTTLPRTRHSRREGAKARYDIRAWARQFRTRTASPKTAH